MRKRAWLRVDGTEMSLNEGYNEAAKAAPIGRPLTPEQWSRLLEWLQVEAERSASDTRGMAARTLLASTGMESLTPNTSNPLTILRNIYLASLRGGDSREGAEFIADMFETVYGERVLESRSTGKGGRRRWRVALTPSGRRTRY